MELTQDGKTQTSRLLLIGTAVLVVAGLAAVYVWRNPAGVQQASMAPATAPAAAGPDAATSALSASVSPAAPSAAGAPVTTAETGKILPSFDAVRVGPDRHAVLAGRAEPGAEVTLFDNNKPIAKTTADGNGEWVLTPPAALPAGTQELSLAARSADAPADAGATRSAATVAVLVPTGKAGTGEAVAPTVVMLPQAAGMPVRAMQLPTHRAPRPVLLDIVQYNVSGTATLTGRTERRATVEIAVNGSRRTAAVADDTGRWQAKLGDLPVGRYRLGLTAIHAGGKPIGDLTLTIRRAEPGEFDADYLAVIPGNTLWHVAQHSYGEGTQFVEIYDANRQRVDNPDRIFSGQLLALPPKP